MHIRGWLTGLIVFLLAPSLLFASLWFHNRLDSFNALDRGLTGLYITQAVGPLLEERALTGSIKSVPAHLHEQLREFGGAEFSDHLLLLLQQLVEEEDTAEALSSGRELSLVIEQLAGVSRPDTYEAGKLPVLLNNLLLSTVIEATKMAINARTVAQRDVVNVWDKMLIPVQGGQFKVAADGAARETARHFSKLHGPTSTELIDAASEYRQANLQFQAKGAKLLSSTIKAATGSDILSAPVIAEYPKLIRASFNLWQGILDYLIADIRLRRQKTISAVIVAGLAGVLIIGAAFAIGVALCRALTVRTLKEFENLGLHDPLTGLPNRRALVKTIRNLTETDQGAQSGLLMLDLRQLKKINDQHGNSNGDSILRIIADHLAKLADPEDFLSRSGSSEFVLFRPNLKDRKAFEKLAAEMVEYVGHRRTVGDHEIAFELNAGVHIHSADNPISENALMDATLALRSAKRKGPGQTAVFAPEMRAAFEHHSATVNELLQAIDAGDIVPWFQPQIDIHTGAIIGGEALVRWVEDGNVRYPGSFLPAAQEAGYMELIDSKVRDKAYELAAALSHCHSGAMHIGLNLSADILSGKGAADALYTKIQKIGLSPSQFSLEILEAVMIDEITAVPIKENIARLSELGFQIELDDFGTGHSSISSLRDLKIDRVKIDRSFVSGVDQKPELQKFTSALINLAKSLDIKVLAEGVETEGERQWLQDNGCDHIQGFLISKAVPAEQFVAKILRQDHLLEPADTVHMVHSLEA